MSKNCKTCGNAIFDSVFGEYKCYVKQRSCTPGEVTTGCEDWSEERAVKVVEKEVRVDGATFIPSVSSDGILSWTNDHNLPNPSPVKIIPEKGTDYFTEADKAEMVQDVISKLPVYNGEVVEL